MRILLRTLFFFLFSCNLSFASGWTIINSTDDGDFYLNVNKIRSDRNYIYYWDMVDLYKPSEGGNLSFQRYNQGDCNIIRYKTLQYFFYDQNLGKGESEKQAPSNTNWKYFKPDSIGEEILEYACKIK